MTDEEPSGPWILCLFTVAGLAEAGMWGQVNAFVPLYLPALGVPADGVPRWTALVTIAGTVAGLASLPLWGALADRYARKPVIVRSFVAYALGCALAAGARGVGAFAVGRTLMGLAMGNSGLMMATLGERLPPRRRSLGFAVFNSAPPLGAFLAPLAGGALVERAGARALFALDAVLMLAVTASLWAGYRDRYTPTTTRPVGELALDSLRQLVASPRLRRLFPTLFALFGAWMLVNLYLPLAVAARFPTGHLATRIGWILAGGGAATVALAPSLGALADRRGLWPVLTLAAAAEALVWPVAGWTARLDVFAASWALANGLASAVFALSFVALSDAAPERARGRVMAYAYLPSTAGYGIASGLGVALGAAAVPHMFSAAAALTAIGCAGLVWTRRAPSLDPEAAR